MGKTNKSEKTPVASWWSALRAEFRKIIWPTRQSVIRQSTAVVAVTAVLGLIIALLDWGIQHGLDYLINLSF